MELLKRFIKKDSYLQSDNRGSFQNTEESATNYWILRNRLKKFEPFLLYEFDDGTAAVRSLLNIPCIKIASDSEDLICIEPFFYGYYPLESGKYEVIFGGEKIPEKLFGHAERSFVLNGGKKINSKRPEILSLKIISEKTEEKIPVSEKPPEVQFVKEVTEEKKGKKYLFRIYKAASEKDAVRFLMTKICINNSQIYIVKTPEGRFGRNYKGIFKQDK